MKGRAAVDRMVNGLYPRTRRGEEVLERVRLVRTIRAGGDLEAELELHVRARGGNLHFREIRFGPGPGGAHADLLGRINFKAQDLTDGQSFAIAYLPTRDEPERKSIVLAFLPAIEPTEKDARKIVVTFEWAGYWKGLLTNRFETTGYSLHGKPVGEVELVYRIQPTLGTIKLTQLTPASPFGIEPYQGDKDGLVGQCYRARQLPGEDVKLKLELVAPGR